MNHDESILQSQIVQALSLHRIYCFAVSNELLGNSRGAARKMAIFKAMGLRSGVSDLVVVLPGRVIFLEVKTTTGRQSPAQKNFQSIVEGLGHQYALVRSVDEALAAVKNNA
ncbi:MAG TPA: VRR-NUC domain-containing protein [Dissulfurispiraceae bacterium]|nr:VRR-NUC domain-containing protein [Dissulfurispiraceae bacterium]